MRSRNRLTAAGAKVVRASVTAMVDRPVQSSFLVAFGVRVVFIVVSGFLHDGVLIPDEGQYLALALVASEGELDETFWPGYGQSMFDSARTFMWPLTALFWIFGPSRLVGQLMAALFGAAAASLTASLAGRFWRPHIALGAGLLVAVFPSQILWSSVVIREAPVWVGLAAIAIVVDWSRRGNSTSRILASALSLGLLYVSVVWLREQTAVLALWCLIPAFLFGCKKMSVRLPCAIFLLVFVPWIMGQGLGASDFAQRSLNRLGSSRAHMSVGADSAFTDPSMGINSIYRYRAGSAISDDAPRSVDPFKYRLYHSSSRRVIPDQPPAGVCDSANPLGETASRLLDRPAGDWFCIYDPIHPTRDWLLVDNRIGTSLRRVPMGLFETMVRPLPWEAGGSPDKLVAGLESILWTVVYGLAIYGVWFHRGRYRLLLFPILLVLSVSVGGAVTHGNLGTAFRHRGQIFFALAVLAMGGVQAIVDVRGRQRLNMDVELVSHQDLAGED